MREPHISHSDALWDGNSTYRLSTLKMEAAGSSKTLAKQCHISEDSDLHSHCCKNFTSHTVKLYGMATLHTDSSTLKMEAARSSKMVISTILN
jgi:hypothetical protein